LILVNASPADRPHKAISSNDVAGPVANSSRIAERLRAHARLCRQIAEQSWSEEVAERLARLADECSRAAADAESEDETIPPRMH
jgi:hypothetical protein